MKLEEAIKASREGRQVQIVTLSTPAGDFVDSIDFRTTTYRLSDILDHEFRIKPKKQVLKYTLILQATDPNTEIKTYKESGLGYTSIEEFNRTPPFSIGSCIRAVGLLPETGRLEDE